MKRYWKDIELPVGVYIHEGINKTSIGIIFTFQNKLHNIILTDSEFEIVNADTILEAGRIVTKIKKQIKNNEFRFEAWFPNLVAKRQYSILPGGRILFEHFIKEFFVNQQPSKNKLSRSPSTLNGYFKITNQLARVFKGLYLDEITPDVIKSWIISMEGSVSKKTVRNLYSLFSAALARARNSNLIHRNPINDVDLKDLLRNWDITKRGNRAFDKDELNKIMSFADEDQFILFTFWVETGLRTSELIALNWEDIDFTNERVDIYKSAVLGISRVDLDENHNWTEYKVKTFLKKPKTEAGDRYVHLSETALSVLKQQQDIVDNSALSPVFLNPRTGKRWSSDKPIRRYWYQLMEKADLTTQNPYQFRHTFCVRQVESKVDAATIQSQMGHSDMSSIINNYAKPAKKKKL